MDIGQFSGVSILIGVLVSLFVQMTKRTQAGTLENAGLVAGVNALAAWMAPMLGSSPDLVPAMIVSYAFHGVAGATSPMQALKLGLTDSVLSGVGKAFAGASSAPLADHRHGGGGGTGS